MAPLHRNGRPTPGRLIACLLLGCLLLGVAAMPARADERQYKVEAAFLYNFFNYITWPGYEAPERMKQASICVPDSDPVLPYLDYIRRKRLPERTLNVRPLEEPSAMKGCQMLFIRNMSAEELARLQPIALKEGVLLVSGIPNFIEQGGMIGLEPDGERLTIEIDNSLLKKANFKVSSRLLDLARKVK